MIVTIYIKTRQLTSAKYKHTPPDKKSVIEDFNLISYIIITQPFKAYIVGTQKNCLIEAVLLRA